MFFSRSPYAGSGGAVAALWTRAIARRVNSMRFAMRKKQNAGVARLASVDPAAPAASTQRMMSW
jgi:hypothetical protein